jgi:hypothetical protein
MSDKLYKILGEQRMNELKGSSVEQLKEVIVTAERQKAEAKRELENNEKYQQIKLVKKDMEASMRDLNKELNAVVKAAVLILEEKGA